MESRLEFKGTGGELFGKLIVGALLTGITFGIYAPWFYVALTKFIYSVTKIRGTAKGDLQPEFTGAGGELFKILIIGGLLTGITFGIYMPWLMVNLIKYFEANSRAKAADGSVYSLQSDLTGGELFVTYLVGALLTGITFGIYTPWFMCKLNKLIYSKTQVLAQGRPAGRMDFVGQGGDLFVTYLVGMLLTGITFGIYGSWFQVKMFKFMAQNTEIQVGGRAYRGDFTGTGGDYFVLNLVGTLLTMITFGIYGFWYMAKSLEFQFNNSVYRPAGAPSPAAAVSPRAPAHA
jgi:uncharacterized membrane protein YjgN (DUF898 family)